MERFLSGDNSFLINNQTNPEKKETAGITLCSGTIKVEPKSPVTDKVQKVIKKVTNMGKKANKEATKCPAAARRNKSPPVNNGTKVNKNTTKKAAKNVKNKYKLHMRQKNRSQENAIHAKHTKAAKL